MDKLVIDKEQLQNDMEALAELVYELSVKYGDIYINAAKPKGSNLAMVACQLNDEEGYRYANYWGKEDKENDE